MPSETLYVPRGAGHSAPGDRRDYNAPDDRLKSIFWNWLEYEPSGYLWGESDDLYRNTISGLPDMAGFTLDDIHATAALFQEHEWFYNVGILLSAMYEKAGFKEIVFDISTVNKVSWLGHMLGEGKTLVIRADAGMRTGGRSKATILNYANIDSFGHYAEGSIVNYGNVAGEAYKIHGLFMNYGTIGMGIGQESPGTLVNFGDVRGCIGTAYDGFFIQRPVRRRGMIINHGAPRNAAIGLLQNEIVISTRDPENPSGWNYAGECPLLLDEEGCKSVPGLLAYLDGLKARFGPKRPYKEILKELETLDIESEVKSILAEAGMWPSSR